MNDKVVRVKISSSKSEASVLNSSSVEFLRLQVSPGLVHRWTWKRTGDWQAERRTICSHADAKPFCGVDHGAEPQGKAYPFSGQFYLPTLTWDLELEVIVWVADTQGRTKFPLSSESLVWFEGGANWGALPRIHLYLLTCTLWIQQYWGPSPNNNWLIDFWWQKFYPMKDCS